MRDNLNDVQLDNGPLYRRARLWMFGFLGCIALDLGLSLLPGALADLFDSHALALLALAALCSMFLLQIGYFYFESAYENIRIDIRLLALQNVWKNSALSYEFPKRKLVRYTLGPNSWGRQKLTLYLMGSLGEVKKLKSMDITFLSAEKRANLSAALEEIVQGNAEVEG